MGTQNKGDIAILLGMLESFKKLSVRSSISVLSHDPKDTEMYTNGFKLNIIERIIKRKENNTNRFFWIASICFWIVQIIIWLLFQKLGVDIKSLFSKDKKVVLSEYLESDLIVSSGGGYLHDNHVSALFLALLSIFVATSLKKKVVLYSQSIGPINKNLYRPFVRSVLNKVDLILVREKISEEFLHGIGVNKPDLIVTGDAAFVYSSMSDDEVENTVETEKIDRSKFNVGITVRHWHFPTFSNSDEMYNNYKQVIAQISDYVIEKYDAEITFIPMIMRDTFNDERLIAEEIISKMRCPEKARVIYNEYSPLAIRHIIGSMDLLIGTRFHSAIFAFTMRVPSIVIQYEHKAGGIMQMMGLDKYLYDINSLDADTMKDAIDEIILKKKDVSMLIDEKVLLMDKLSAENISVINNYFFN